MVNEVIGIDNVSLVYASKKANVHALDSISFAANKGEFVALVGPSGCGKSTLLKLVAGLIPASSGSIRVNGKPVCGPTRSVGIVFQSPLLMPWRTVLQNVMLQIDIRGLPAAEFRATARELIRLVGLDGFGMRCRINCRAACSSALVFAGR
jgi:NitT/TauT family transport system ATP-binding protein